jgi:Na+/H+ antiporter NhaD/arsenite permease-like protein
MQLLIISIFILGYLAIALEHNIRVDKAASALLCGVLCWTVLVLASPEHESITHALNEHLSGISGILFFLLGAMVIVEIIDAHDGFDIITRYIRTRSKRILLWLIAGITFFLSAILDNLTTTIVMVSLLRKLMVAGEDRLLFIGMVVVAANAGGAWSPMGDVTTTMLWVDGQISAGSVMRSLFLPSLVCLLVPLLLLNFRLKGHITSPEKNDQDALMTTQPYERNLIFGLGLAALLFVPVFKTITHLPPFMGILFGLGTMWIVTELIHRRKDAALKGPLSAQQALQRIDTPSILFFLGILVAISALESAGQLSGLATWLDRSVGNITYIGIIIGLFSAIVDNVPLVAAAQGMYDLTQYPQNHYFWELLAYCAGTGGSILIIGSAAGVAAMGMENIAFGWYLRRIGGLALAGYLAGALVYALIR